jgi:hypothetical protein
MRNKPIELRALDLSSSGRHTVHMRLVTDHGELDLALRDTHDRAR